MTHVSLFTGIGGLDLAAEWAGFETVLQVEMDDYANKVLEKHWPDVPRVRDIRDVNKKSIDRPITVISGGFPCQPFSAAGKRGGRDDDRYLWPEMLRVIRELSPSWVVGENVAGLLSINEGMEIESIITDLENEGYEIIPTLYPAVGVGAPHRRDRVFIVAHSRHSAGTGKRERKQEVSEELRTGGEGWIYAKDMANNDSLRMEGKGPEQQTTGPCGESQDLADTYLDRQQTRRLSIRPGRQNETSSKFTGNGEDVADTEAKRRKWPGGAWSRRYGFTNESGDREGSVWNSEPDVGRVANGVPSRVDRLKCLGNAVVPQQAYPIFKAIAEVTA